jgi:hypothetical protein
VCQDCSAKKYTEEHGDGDGFANDDIDEEDGEGSVKSHLEDEVDCHQDHAILIFVSCKPVPDENLEVDINKERRK